eukprot:Ihof_evm1s711 gene=Ihof_evmTU1s711
MSGTSVRVTNEPEVREALRKVRDDADSSNWVVCSHDNKPDLIKLVGLGSGGLSELRAAITDDNVSYALLRVTEKVDLSETVKFVYLHFIGQKLSLVKKGRYGIVYGDVTTRFFSPHHVMFSGIEDFEDINEGVVMQKVAEASGTAKHELASTEGRQVRSFTGKPTNQDSPHLNKTPAQVTVARGQASGQISGQASGKTSSKVSGKAPTERVAVETQKADLMFGADLKEGIALVRNDQSNINWVLGSYEDDNVRKPVVLVAKGSEGLAEFVQNLNPAKVLYGILRTTDDYEGIITVKFVYFRFVGDDVSFMQRARISVHKGATEAFFA